MENTTHTPMQTVHDVLAAEFGRMAPPLKDDDQVQLVYLPGGRYALFVCQSTETTVSVRKAVGEPDFTRPGLADYLLTDHRRWLFGRFERNDDMLVIEHTLAIDSLTPETLVRVVRAVHDAAYRAEHMLLTIGAMEADED